MTNFSAVCVSENLTTLTSTRPAAFPAFITSASDTCGLPFGRIVHKAPSRFSRLASPGSAESAARDSTPQKIRSGGRGAADADAVLLQFSDEVRVGYPHH